MQGDGQAVRVAADVQLAREATARAAKTIAVSPPFRRRRSGAPGRWCCRSSARGRPRRRRRPRPPVSRPTGPRQSSVETGGTPSSSCQVQPAGRVTARLCAQSKTQRPARADDLGQACRRAGSQTPRRARRRTAPRLSEAHGSTPIHPRDQPRFTPSPNRESPLRRFVHAA